MARKVEPALVEINKAKILKAAKNLFYTKGFEASSMDDVAKRAGMSKSTLYVYFKSKEELKNTMSLEAMRFFHDRLQEELTNEVSSMKDTYIKICNIMVEFKQKYPLNFEIIIENIPVDDESLSSNIVLRKIYELGEQINVMLGYKLIANGFTTDRKELSKRIFVLWGSLYGLITLAENKQSYIGKSMGVTKEEFLCQGFEQLFRAI